MMTTVRKSREKPPRSRVRKRLKAAVTRQLRTARHKQRTRPPDIVVMQRNCDQEDEANKAITSRQCNGRNNEARVERTNSTSRLDDDPLPRLPDLAVVDAGNPLVVNSLPRDAVADPETEIRMVIQEEEVVHEYQALRDYRSRRDKKNRLIEEIEIEWKGGKRTWQRRQDTVTESCAEDIEAIVLWHTMGRQGEFAAFRRARFGRRPRYTTGESGLCGFVAVKFAFRLLGHDWVTDDIVAEYIDGGDRRGKNYRRGVTWEQLLGFIRFVNAKLGRAPTHPCTRKIAQNLRDGTGEGRDGVARWAEAPGVYLVGFCRARVAHFVVVQTTISGEKIVHDDTGSFALEVNEWMDSSQLVRVHRVSVA